MEHAVAAGFSIKPLEWVRAGNTLHGRIPGFSAPLYIIGPRPYGRDGVYLMAWDETSDRRPFPGLETAQAAAEDEFQLRMSSVVVPSATGVPRPPNEPQVL